MSKVTRDRGIYADGEAVIMLAFQASGRGSTPLRRMVFLPKAFKSMQGLTTTHVWVQHFSGCARIIQVGEENVTLIGEKGGVILLGTR